MADELTETVELYRAAARERDALRAALNAVVYQSEDGAVYNTYKSDVDLTEKHPNLRTLAEPM